MQHILKTSLLVTSFLTFSLVTAFAQTETRAPNSVEPENLIEEAIEEADTVVSDLIEQRDWQHGTSLIGEPKYPENFEYFDYVNPDAPKGGTVRLSETGSFDTLNFVPPRGEIPPGLGLIYESLMTSAMDEISTMYGQLAESLSYPDDYSSVTYRLREGARWHDGKPVTPEDVVWSFEVLTENNPQQAFYYSHVTGAEVTGEREVTFTFDQTGNRELPHIVGQLLIMPKHWWTAEDVEGNPRDITRSTLEKPLGSGPYRVSDATPGRSITYERVEDYWGENLPVNIGKNNFDQIRYEFFRDSSVELEAFKADRYDWRVENTAKDWATAYNIPAVENGSIVLEMFDQPYNATGLMSGFIFNLRRPLFEDPKVREAFNYALDFRQMNRQIFFDQYVRVDSYFFGIPLAAQGEPQGLELEMLRDVQSEHPDFVPESVFGSDFENPTYETPEERRDNLRKAQELFEQAGWQVSNEPDPEQADQGFVQNILITIGLAESPTRRVMRDASGSPVEFEFLINSPAFERVALGYKEDLSRLGITLNIRLIDSAQYVNRVRGRDFDMIYAGWAQSMSPGNEQRDFFGSQSADRDGSRNFGGIQNPAVDALIDKIIFAPDREHLEAATKAMDRVLLANHYVVPGWTLRSARVARWDRFSHPETLPEYSEGFPTIWWYDKEKASHVMFKSRP
jgi:microcin C transport system substrate-binding protein